MRLVHLLLTGTTLATLADVMPHCGRTEVSIQAPGQECGPHGSRWRGDCRAPAECIAVEKKGRQCTRRCTTDADCTVFGASFRCTGSETPSYGVDATAVKV